MARKPSVANLSKSAKVSNKQPVSEEVRALLENRHMAILKFTYCFPGCDPTGRPLPCYADMVMGVHDLVNWYRLLRMPNACDVDVLTQFLDSTPLWIQLGG